MIRREYVIVVYGYELVEAVGYEGCDSGLVTLHGLKVYSVYQVALVLCDLAGIEAEVLKSVGHEVEVLVSLSHTCQLVADACCADILYRTGKRLCPVLVVADYAYYLLIVVLLMVILAEYKEVVLCAVIEADEEGGRYEGILDGQ